MIFILLFNIIISNNCSATYVEKTPTRVVALVPSLAEMVIDLGFGNTLAGVPEYTKLDRTSISAVILGPYPNISVESIVALKPDLILASSDGNRKELTDMLQKFGIRVEVFRLATLREINNASQKLSNLYNVRDHAMVKNFEELIRTSQEDKKNTCHRKIKTSVIISQSPLVTVGSQSFINELLDKSGLENIFSEIKTAYPQVQLEELFARKPDIIILAPMNGSSNNDLNFSVISKSIKVFKIPSDLISKPGYNLIKAQNALFKLAQCEACSRWPCSCKGIDKICAGH